MSISIVLLPNGQMRHVNLPAADTLPLTLDLLDCFAAERHPIRPHVAMWIDAGGHGLREANMPATKLSVRYGGVWKPYYGPVLLCGIDEQGRSRDLTVSQIRELLPYLLRIA
ncbi:hypothetical protein ACIBHY_29915 [Nonomuraea sp. NPDC050547]|uniref:hypothetical protein n=1 Tax=Nonomuraea sp. NPDC050547 TaxID=3364368 RepID=UPI0037AD6CA8